MLEKLMNDPYAWFFLSILSVFSVFFGICTWYAGKQRKELSIHCKSDILIKAGKQRIPKLDILYDGNEIDDLSSTKFYIWNSGNQVLHNTDIVSSKPLRIYADDDAKILDVQIIRVSDTTNAFGIAEKTGSSAQFDFEYVDHGDGILVQVLHTGDPLKLIFDCKIKGGREIKDRTPTHKDRKITVADRFWDFVATEFAFGVWMVFTFFGAFFSYNFVSIYENEQMTLVGLLIFFLATGLCFFVGLKLSKLINKSANNLFHRSIPESLLAANKKV